VLLVLGGQELKLLAVPPQRVWILPSQSTAGDRGVVPVLDFPITAWGEKGSALCCVPVKGEALYK